jgi:DNA polymerase III subunit delta
MADLKCAYLVSGDDDAKIDSWRGRVRRRAESELGPGGLEQLDGQSAGPDEAAAAVAALTFDTGTRYILVDGIEGWKPSELEPLERALAGMPPDTVLVLIARGKAPGGLGKAVERAGGETRTYEAPKPWELPRWVVERAQEEGLRLDADAAKALISSVGTRQQRLTRELERLALAVHPAGRLVSDDVDELASGEVAPEVYDLADAIVAGDAAKALAVAEGLRVRDERIGSVLFPVVRRLRDVQRAAELLEAGVPEQDVKRVLRMSPWAAKRTLAQAKRADRHGLERALCALADLELETRGGGDLDEDTALTLAVARAAG